MDKEIYARTQARQKRTGSLSLCCVYCGESNPAVIEMHHVIGKSNSDEVIPLCKNCHAKITDEQNKLPREKRKGTSFILVSIGALLKEAGNVLINLGHEVAVNE
ncbi:MAG TPA: HNH endonuclease [Methanoculleus sp.]|nr:HNH endonuclease [Methanoculleus sp.]